MPRAIADVLGSLASSSVLAMSSPNIPAWCRIPRISAVVTTKNGGDRDRHQPAQRDRERREQTAAVVVATAFRLAGFEVEHPRAATRVGSRSRQSEIVRRTAKHGTSRYRGGLPS